MSKILGNLALLSFVLAISFAEGLKAEEHEYSYFYNPSTFTNLQDKFKSICLEVGVLSTKCRNRVQWLSESEHHNLDSQSVSVFSMPCSSFATGYIQSLSGDITEAQRGQLQAYLERYCRVATRYPEGPESALFYVNQDDSLPEIIAEFTDYCDSITYSSAGCLAGEHWIQSQNVQTFKNLLWFDYSCEDLLTKFATLEHESLPNKELLAALSNWGACHTVKVPTE